MAKKKKSSAGSKSQVGLSRASAQGHGAGFLWVSAIGGMLLVMLYLVLPWNTVLGATKSSLGMTIEAIGKGNFGVAMALAFTLLPALLASALPFLPQDLKLRERLAILTVTLASINILILTILTRSTRSFLALGEGRQVVRAEIVLLVIVIGVILGGLIGYLLNRDSEVEGESHAGWYAALLFVIFAVAYFNYSVIPGSLITPPEYIRQRMEFME